MTSTQCVLPPACSVHPGYLSIAVLLLATGCTVSSIDPAGMAEKIAFGEADSSAEFQAVIRFVDEGGDGFCSGTVFACVDGKALVATAAHCFAYFAESIDSSRAKYVAFNATWPPEGDEEPILIEVDGDAWTHPNFGFHYHRYVYYNDVAVVTLSRCPHELEELTNFRYIRLASDEEAEALLAAEAPGLTVVGFGHTELPDGDDAGVRRYGKVVIDPPLFQSKAVFPARAERTLKVCSEAGETDCVPPRTHFDSPESGAETPRQSPPLYHDTVCAGDSGGGQLIEVAGALSAACAPNAACDHARYRLLGISSMGHDRCQFGGLHMRAPFYLAGLSSTPSGSFAAPEDTCTPAAFAAEPPDPMPDPPECYDVCQVNEDWDKCVVCRAYECAADGFCNRDCIQDFDCSHDERFCRH